MILLLFDDIFHKELLASLENVEISIELIDIFLDLFCIVVELKISEKTIILNKIDHISNLILIAL